MRGIRLLLLTLVTLGTGCDDGLGLGIGTRCAAEKQRVRQQFGQPDRVEEGARSEFWVYNARRITYEFSWDQTGERCVVRTAGFQRTPAAFGAELP